MEVLEKVRLRSAKGVKKNRNKFVRKMLQTASSYDIPFEIVEQHFIFKATPSEDVVVEYKTLNGHVTATLGGVVADYPDIETAWQAIGYLVGGIQRASVK